MLHAPDFLGYASAIELAQDHRELVERALRMKKTGNALMTSSAAARSTRSTSGSAASTGRREARARDARRDARARREFALETVRLTAGLDFPDFEQDYELVALAAPDSYPIEAAGSCRTAGSTSRSRSSSEHFVEQHVERSNALHSRMVERGTYLVGPLARWALSGDRLSPLAREAAEGAGLARRAQPVPHILCARSSSSTRPTRRSG